MQTIYRGKCGGSFIRRKNTLLSSPGTLSTVYQGSSFPIESILIVRSALTHYKIFLNADETDTLFSLPEDKDIADKHQILIPPLREILNDRNIQSSFINPFFICDVRRVVDDIEYPVVSLEKNEYTQYFEFTNEEKHVWFEPFEYWYRLIEYYCTSYIACEKNDIANDIDEYKKDRDYYSMNNNLLTNSSSYIPYVNKALVLNHDYQGLLLQPWIGDNIRYAWLVWYNYFSTVHGKLFHLPQKISSGLSRSFSEQNYFDVIEKYAMYAKNMLSKDHIKKLERQTDLKYPYNRYCDAAYRSFNFAFD